jgi:hypothetical protein
VYPARASSFLPRYGKKVNTTWFWCTDDGHPWALLSSWRTNCIP